VCICWNRKNYKMFLFCLFVYFLQENLEHISISDNRCTSVVCNLQEFSTQLPVNCVLPANTRGLVLHKHSSCLLSIITWSHNLSLPDWSCVCVCVIAWFLCANNILPDSTLIELCNLKMWLSHQSLVKRWIKPTN
jgi:hypothetical protein